MRRLVLGALGLAAALAWAGCSDAGGAASARQVTNRIQLIGGDRALGDVGDFMLENEKIRAVIQGPGFSRGFGVYGGSLIDADLRRPDEIGTSGKPKGNDQFGELFPAFFVQAVNVDRVAIDNDGRDGNPARVIATGEAGDFLELAALLNRAVTGSNVDFQSLTSPAQIRYRTTYELESGKRWIKITFRIENISEKKLQFPSELSLDLLGIAGLPVDTFKVPFCDIALFGATSQVWIPGVGFDSRFGLEDAYQKKVDFPAFPGVLAEFVASRGDGASYGLAIEGSERSFVLQNRAVYDDGTIPIDQTTMLVPFSASSFLGVFHDTAPPELGPGQAYDTTKYFLIGSGDVGSVVDVLHELRGTPTGMLGGQVFDDPTGVPAKGTSVLVYQRNPVFAGGRRIYSQYDVRADGFFGGTLPPGDYSLRVQGNARQLGPFVDFSIKQGQSTAVRTTSKPPGRITVNLLDENGHPIPAKTSALGLYNADFAGQLTRKFLFDLQAGEPFRRTDMVTDDPDNDETRRYVEAIAFSKDGVATLSVRPGTYRVVSSRGPEYDLVATDVTVGANESASVTHKLLRIVNTPGFISGDLHVHSRNSIDSAMTLDDRVVALAAEGVEWAVSTDHNFVTDYRPYAARNELFPWLYPMVGVEMTTLESGHFNGYPLTYQPGPVTHGAFAWAGRPPQAIFDDLRGLGSLGRDRTIVQVNHPRDGVLGYFSQYQRSPLTGDLTPPGAVQEVLSPRGPAFRTEDGQSAFSFGFDAMEVANGKLFSEIHHYRVPDHLPEGDLPANVPPAGHIVVKANGDPAFPGTVEDWFNLLNLGRRFIAVGTADSHSGIDEAGQFRTMVYVGDDRPITLTDERLVDAFRSRHVVATNAPLIDFWIDDPVRGVMGQTISTANAQIDLHYHLTSASWASVARLNIWRNGVIAKVIDVDPDRDLARQPLDGVETLDLAHDASGAVIDCWFVVEGIGYKSLFPAITPLEVPPVLLTEAVSTLAGPLGLGSDELGALRPPEFFPVTAFAITNPVWVTTHAGGDFNPPGVVPFAILDRPENDPKMQAFIYPKTTVRLPKKKLMALTRPVDRYEPRGRVPMFYPRMDNPFDVRKAFARFGHLAGHNE